MDFIAQLLKDKEKHLKLIKAIDLVLESHGHKVSELVVGNIEAPLVSNSNRGKRFPKGGTYFEQIEFIFDDRNRFLHTQEIARVIAEKENVKDLKWLVRRVSANLSKFKKQQDLEGLINYQFGKQTRDNVWGFNKWMDANGNIKPQYLYVDKETLTK